MACSNNGKANNGKPRPQLLAFLISLFLAILDLVPSLTYAESDINIQNIPTELAEALGIPTFAGHILISGITMLMFLLPICLLTRKGRGSWIPEVAGTFIIMGFCIAVGWLPYWFLIIIAMFTALMFSGNMRDLITGKGK